MSEKYASFLKCFKTSSVPKPLRQLVGRLLRSAIEDYVVHYEASTKEESKLFKAAEYWLFKDEGSYSDKQYMSFEFVCDTLRLDPSRCRKKIKELIGEADADRD